MRNPGNRMVEGLVGHRCPGCRMLAVACLCELVPRVETRTRVLVVLHHAETQKPSNTGRLALRCLPNSGAVIRGAPDQPTAAPGPDWAEHGDPVVLFPHPDARPLAEFCGGPRPVTLIVPDGTWRQAQRVRRRVPGLAEVPCAFITRDAPSEYRLRRTPDARRLSTMEAIAEALGLLEGPRGPAARELLLNIFQIMVDRSLRGRALQRGPQEAQEAQAAGRQLRP
jgi:DTW domain-containing protein YfiP